MPDPRLLIDQALSAGAEIALDDAQARHVGAVLRLDVGDGLRVFNARDGEWRAKVTAKSKRGMSVQAQALLRAPRAVPDLELLFAPVKRHATDLIVEKATELGVRRIRPVITQRTIAETVRLDRLNAIAREAAEQTERFDVPEIYGPVSLVKALDGWDGARLLIYADEQGDEASAPWGGDTGRAAALLEVLDALGVAFDKLKLTPGVRHAEPVEAQVDLAPPPHKLALLIGPEGGFTTEERAMLRALAFVQPVSLGPRILRAETAAIAALSIIQAAWGDWR